MDGNTAGLVGAGIGAGALLLSQFLSSWHQRRSAREEWLRNKLHDVYANVLTHLNGPDYQARDRWLDTLLIYYRRSATADLPTFLDKVRRGAIRRHDIVALALADERLGGGRLPSSTANSLVGPGEE